VTVTNGAAGELHRHLFVRPDGVQVLFVYDKQNSPTVAITLERAGQRAFAYELDGTAAPFADFDGAMLSNVALTPGEVAIFAVEP
jgi:polysaccharide biosynthesis protein PslG